MLILKCNCYHFRTKEEELSLISSISCLTFKKYLGITYIKPFLDLINSLYLRYAPLQNLCCIYIKLYLWGQPLVMGCSFRSCHVHNFFFQPNVLLQYYMFCYCYAGNGTIFWISEHLFTKS